ASMETYVILGITGSIAAYKTPELARLFVADGLKVRTVLTKSAMKFVTPMVMETLTGYPALSDIFSAPLAHISIPKGGDAFVIAPASLNTLSKFAAGLADNLLTTMLMAFRGNVLVAPAMNWRMYENPIFQDKLNYLKSKGIIEIPPVKGNLACGEEGIGKMASPETILHYVKRALSKQDLYGKKIIVTAGPTREYIDPVRFISNRSSGKMGYAIARAAFERGATVTLISGPTSLPTSDCFELIRVETSEEMEKEVYNHTGDADILVMSAAIADFKPEEIRSEKYSRSDGLSLNLVKTNDIVAGIASRRPRPFIVGFSAETGNRLDRAREKMALKGIDMMVFNDVTAEGAGFDVDTNIITIITGNEALEALEALNDPLKYTFPMPKMTKDKAAHAIFDKIHEVIKRKTSHGKL
ncbi:MAG: bifunctional phosphopantothenoylcysteine decarboxylase/phosphopantothenate--cysteine ligase CoaBC, partial [Nitrospirae bacterium]|nr:bifunctional phosphopantothenoylcysteine decarboxylase/phosphopantothenate--cysteine ligase CoaBC [Nitrospirota bacterium]